MGLAPFAALVMWTLIRRWWRGVLACAAVPIAIAITEQVLEPLVDRKVPESPELFYPSGHLTGDAPDGQQWIIMKSPEDPR